MRARALVLGVSMGLALGCASSSHGGRAPAAPPVPAAPPPQTMPPSPPVFPAPPPSPLELLRHDIDSMVAAAEFRNAHWGILIVDPERGDTLYSHNAGKLFLPASNMKIVTGAVALALLGPEFRFRTTFAARGAICRGVLDGDLVVHGRGDPTVSDSMRGDAMQPLREIADSLAARGIKRIAGALVPGDDTFPDSSFGFGWAWDDLAEPYSAGVDELFFNEGVARVVVRAGRRGGSPVTATVLPLARYPRLRLAARTAAPWRLAENRSGDGRLDEGKPIDLTVAVDPVRGEVVIAGAIAPALADTLAVVFPDQRRAYLAALEQALTERGIAVGRPARGERRPARCRAHRAGTALDTLFVYQSLPLRDILRAMEKPSQNQIAEILLRTIGLERTGVGRADSGASVVARQLLAWGAAPDGFVIRDGSGLSRYDYLSPETIVRVLAAIRHDTAFTAFYDALPVAGVDGTIAYRMRGTPAQGNVHAKTGFVANARSLSGYVTTADGRELVFSVLCNNWTAPVRDIERVQDAIAVRLAMLTGAGER